MVVAGLPKGARDVELPPWQKGRYGSAVGRAVHGVLQTVDLATGAGLDDAVAAQCLAEGVAQHAEHVRALVADRRWPQKSFSAPPPGSTGESRTPGRSRTTAPCSRGTPT